jgi:hypothetical protein
MPYNSNVFSRKEILIILGISSIVSIGLYLGYVFGR